MNQASNNDNHSKGVILVADDLAPNRTMLADTLKAFHYEVHTAKDGAEALQLCAEIEFDAVLLDIMMPHFTGYEVCAHLRANASTEHVPVILVTALTGRSDRIEGVEAGANDFLIKPIDMQDLVLRVRNSVRMKRLRDEVSESLRQLRESERLRDNLTHMVVHDMRNLLLGVSGNLELLRLQAGASLDARQLRPVEQARRASKKLEEMAGSLLDISRLEGGKMPMNPGSHALHQVVTDAIADLGLLTRDVAIEIDMAPEFKAHFDRDLISRVIQNLVSNAVDFVPVVDGSVWIGCAENQDGSVSISISDNGPGVPEASRNRIFEKFATDSGGRTNTSRPSGGLGLAFCKLAVEAHGGRIGVEAGEAAGSRFWFTLPAPTASEEEPHLLAAA